MDDALTDLQTGFQDYILGRSDRVLGRVESTASLYAERRLDIYHNAYRARLAEVLADTYERVALYIGEESFEKAALAFIEQHRSARRNLRDYGAAFPAFLGEYFADDPDVAELAEMDQRLRNAFDAVDAPVLAVSDLATLQPEDWDEVVFILHPTVTFQQFNCNTPAIWQSVSDEQTPPPAALLPEPVTWLFWRKELQPHFRSLSVAEHAALRAIGEGERFGAICAMLAQTWPELDVTTAIARWLRQWLEDGVLAQAIDFNRG